MSKRVRAAARVRTAARSTFVRCILAGILLLTASPLYGRGHWQGWVVRGGLVLSNSGVFSITRSGSAVTDPSVQQSFPQASVNVYVVGTTTSVTIYSDSAGTPKANPFPASTTGYVDFYTDAAAVDLRFSGGGITSPFTLSDVQITAGGANDFVPVVTCDGTTAPATTNATNINAAITSAVTVGGTVRLPDGVCVVGAEIQIPTNPARTGAGITLTGVPSAYDQSATGSGTTLRANDESMRSVLAVLSLNNTVENLWIDAADKSTYAVYFHTAWQTKLSRIMAWNAELDGYFVDENSGPIVGTQIFAEINGTTYASAGIISQYGSRVRSQQTGTAATTASNATVTFTGAPDLTTLGIRKGDIVRVGPTAASAFYGKIASVTATTVVLDGSAGNLPTSTTTLQDWAVGVGDGFHIANNAVNSNINVLTATLFRDNGGSGYSGHYGTGYGDTLIGMQMDYNSMFGISVGPANNVGAIFGLKVIRPYNEANVAGDFWIGDVRDFDIDAPTGTVFAAVRVAASSGTIHHSGYEESWQYGAPQSFIFQIENNAGTLRHRFISDLFSIVDAAIVDRITGAAVTWTNTVTVDGSTAFTGGAGILSGSANVLYLDTSGKSQNSRIDGICSMESNSTGTSYTVALAVASSNVNGTTKSRTSLRLIDGAGVQTNWNTTTIPSGKHIAVRCMALHIR